MNFVFEWDEQKAQGNLRKHGIAFDEAKTVFNDMLLLSFPDVAHSTDEERFINLGFSGNGRLLTVIHTERSGAIRIISARKATRSERRFYESENQPYG